MKINNYFYAHSTVELHDRFQLLTDRSKFMTDQYIDMFKEQLESIKLRGKTAFIYAPGVTTHLGEHMVYEGSVSSDMKFKYSAMGIKGVTAYMAHKYLKALAKNNNIDFMTISSNTCASSMYALYEANLLLNEYDNVIIISDEKTSANTLITFKQSNIDVKVGEGFVCVVLSKGGQLSNFKWFTEYNANPFKVTTEGYAKVYSDCDVVKVHGTGTITNDEAESLAFGHKPLIKYKDKIGHTQGPSGLIELCMALDDNAVRGDVLCVSSGLGGFYGSCILHKDK